MSSAYSTGRRVKTLSKTQNNLHIKITAEFFFTKSGGNVSGHRNPARMRQGVRTSRLK